jgi:hypothetical protein
VFLYSEHPKYHYFLSSKNGAKTTLRVLFKKQNSKKTGSKCKMQRHNPTFREEILEIRGNPAVPSAQKFPLFLNPHQPKYHKFPKAQNGAEITVLGFVKK